MNLIIHSIVFCLRVCTCTWSLWNILQARRRRFSVSLWPFLSGWQCWWAVLALATLPWLWPFLLPDSSPVPAFGCLVFDVFNGLQASPAETADWVHDCSQVRVFPSVVCRPQQLVLVSLLTPSNLLSVDCGPGGLQAEIQTLAIRKWEQKESNTNELVCLYAQACVNVNMYLRACVSICELPVHVCVCGWVDFCGCM